MRTALWCLLLALSLTVAGMANKEEDNQAIAQSEGGPGKGETDSKGEGPGLSFGQLC